MTSRDGRKVIPLLFVVPCRGKQKRAARRFGLAPWSDCLTAAYLSDFVLSKIVPRVSTLFSLSFFEIK